MSAAEDRLGEIEARATAATDGPWTGASSTRYKDGYGVVGRTSNRGSGIAIAVLSSAEGNRANDTRFIAHARTDVPLMAAALLAVLALHSPEPYALPEYPPDWCVPIAVCRICVTEDGLGAVAAPCPTVTAITAALTPAEVAL